MDWNSSHSFLSPRRKSSTMESVNAAQNVTRVLSDLNFSKEQKVSPTGLPAMIMNQPMSHQRVNDLKKSPCGGSIPQVDSLSHMVSVSLEALNKSIMNPYYRNLMQEPRAPCGFQKAYGFANNQPVVSFPFMTDMANNSYCPPANTPYCIPQQSFISLCDDPPSEYQRNFVNLFCYDYLDPSILTPVAKKAHKLNPEAAEYIPQNMRSEKMDCKPLDKNISTTSLPDQNIATIDQKGVVTPSSAKPQPQSKIDQEFSSCGESLVKNTSSADLVSKTKPQFDEKGSKDAPCPLTEEVIAPNKMPLPVNSSSLVLEHDCTEINKLDASLSTSNCSNSPTDHDSVSESLSTFNCSNSHTDHDSVNESSSPLNTSLSIEKVHELVEHDDVASSCDSDKSFPSTANNSNDDSGNHSLHPVCGNGCSTFAHQNSVCNENIENEDCSDFVESEDSDSESSMSSSSSTDEYEGDDSENESESDDENYICFMADEDGIHFDFEGSSRPLNEPVLVESFSQEREEGKEKGCDSCGAGKSAETNGTESRDTTLPSGERQCSGWGILSYILRRASISEDSHESDEEEEDSSYDCELFTVELDDSWNIPIGNLDISNIISVPTPDGEESSDHSPKSADTEKLVDEVDSGKINEEMVRLNDKWDTEVTQNLRQTTPRKVNFCDNVECHPIEEWCRRGPWEQYSLDRLRFRRRVHEMESVLGPVLDVAHRWKVFQRLKQQYSPTD